MPSSVSGAPGYSVHFGYDVQGLMRYALFGSDTGAGITNTYDGFGRLRLSSTNFGGVTRHVASDDDAHGNRTRLTHPDGAFFEYAYDNLDRPVHVSENGPSITLASIFYGDRLIAEYSGSGALLRRYVRYEGASVSAANRRYLHANHQGSIVALTGASGTTLQVNAYDPYGVTGASNAGRFQYTGQAAIPELGLYYYKARFYNPRLVRFMQTDPVGSEVQMNLMLTSPTIRLMGQTRRDKVRSRNSSNRQSSIAGPSSKQRLISATPRSRYLRQDRRRWIAS